MLEFAQHPKDWTILDWYMVICIVETKINRFRSNGRAWYWVKVGESQSQAHRARIKQSNMDVMQFWCGVV